MLGKYFDPNEYENDPIKPIVNQYYQNINPEVSFIFYY
jgi:hypothetical protein